MRPSKIDGSRTSKWCRRHNELVDANRKLVRDEVEELEGLGKELARVCKGEEEVWGKGNVVRIRPRNSSCLPFFRKEVEYTQILREKNKALIAPRV